MSADQPSETAALEHSLPPLTFDKAINHASGMLELAANQEDLARMERFNLIADSWAYLASLLSQGETQDE